MALGKILLSITELGGYPDFTRLYQEAGSEVHKATAVRKALASIRRITPDVIVTEFVYGPIYGSRISTLESLIAGLQKHAPEVKLIVLLERQDQHQFERISARFPIFETLYFPIQETQLAAALERASAAT